MDRKHEEELRCFIPERFKVSSHRGPHYLRWINKYLEFSRDRPSSGHQQDDFLQFIDSNYATWQTDQAEKAVSIYRSFHRQAAEKYPHTIQRLDNSNWKYAVLNMQNELRLQNKSLQTERSYLYWAKGFAHYCESQCPDRLGQDDVKGFLTYLAVERSVAIATQKQAFNAILFLFHHVLGKTINDPDSVIRSRVPRRLPVVLSRAEVSDVTKQMPHPHRLMAEMIYGGGLRLSECLKLRIKDVDFQDNVLTVRSGKGDKDRQTLMSE